MLPRQVLDRAVTPDGTEVLLCLRDTVYQILVDGDELMSSRSSGSEDSLARLGLEPVPKDRPARVLIGGLGMGFTLRTALDGLPARSEVHVAELLPAVVAWNRGPLAAVAGRPLDDRRVRLHMGDVRDQLGDAAFDAIMLDVDNGPEAFTVRRNDWLYQPGGLARLRSALRPGGTLAVWSSHADRSFEARLARVFERSEAITVTSRPGGKGRRGTIFRARVSASRRRESVRRHR